MMNKIVYPLAASTFGDEEIFVAKQVLDSKQLTMGEKVRQFEKEFANWVGAKHALMVNSGSSANLLMVEACLRRSKTNPPLKRGDEVLVPALAWPTTVWPLAQLGLVPVYVDVDPKTLAIDLQSAKSVLTPKTKGMFLIHVLGQAADMNKITKFCKENGITLLEDTCESLGAYFNEKHTGTMGLMGSYSCFFSHHISTMEGGLIVTNDSDLYDDLKSMRAHGWIRDRSDKEEWLEKYPEIDSRFFFVLPGYNVRPTEIQGAIGSVQLKKLESMLIKREELAAKINAIVSKNIPWLELIGAEHLSSTHNHKQQRRNSWMNLPFRVKSNAPISLKKAKETLESHGIETRPIIAGNLARHPANKFCETKSASSLKECDRLLQEGFMLGCHPFLTEECSQALEAAFYELSKL